MLWAGGASDTYGGKRFKGSVGDFVERVLRARASVVAEKRRGWVVTPTSNSDGHRVNASTTAVHAVSLDCDGSGHYRTISNLLGELGFAHILYQSGGWSPATPKWHLLLILDSPSDTSDPAKIDAHKRAYQAVRVVLGALAELSGEGFDPTVETPSVPVFITERRAEADPPRQVIWREGRALDLAKLLDALPPLPRDSHHDRFDDEIDEVPPLADDKLEAVVAQLCAPMSKILSGRRDLYLCLAGALAFDRALADDDVLSVIEQLSLRCPGDPSYTRKERDDRHRQHVHDAETTLKKRRDGGVATRIGTLVECWPDVARALDAALPNAEWQDAVDWLDELRSGGPPRAGSHRVPERSGPAPRAPQVPPIPLSAVTSAVRKLRNKKRDDEDREQRIRGAILDAAIDGEDLVPRVKGQPYVRESGGPYDRASALEAAVWSIVMSCDKSVLDIEALQIFFRRSIAAMLTETEGPDQLQALVASTFKLAAKRRRASEEERREKERAHLEALQRAYGRAR
jgi:hypothetical protein